MLRHYTDVNGVAQIQRHAFTYYKNGELHTETDANGHTTTWILNNLDQRVETQFENGSTTQMWYDAMGAKIRDIDQSLTGTDYRYDALGRLEEVQPDVAFAGVRVPVTAYTYDEVGNKLTQTDVNGHTTTWTYDYFGRVLTRQLPELMTESFIYVDGLGCTNAERANCANVSDPRTVVHTDFNGDVITTAYDIMGRVATVHYSKDNLTERYTYYANGQLETVTDQHGTTTYYYDDRDRLETEIRPNGEQVDYSYDAAGNRTSVVITRGLDVSSSTAYTYDELNRLDTVIDSSGTTTYSYDAVGNLDMVIYPNGLETDYDYNTINQLTDVYTWDANSNLVKHYNYGLLPTGRRETITELNGRITTYAYDGLYRLTSESIVDPVNGNYTSTYEYDWVGNRTYETVNGVQTAYTYDDNDRLEQSGGTSYAYDNNGNTLSTTLDGFTTTYTWNGKNKLIATTGTSGTTNYSYNHNGIRTGKTENGVSTHYVVDENRDYAQVLEEVVDGTTTVAYTYGHDLINQNRNNTTSYFHYDGLGSTRALSDAGGSLTDSYDYEAFGEVLNQTGATENSYLFTGEQFDQTLNQYYLRARYYDQGVGRFTQMDTWGGINRQPISLNKYLYANADPIIHVDPSGYYTAEFGGFVEVEVERQYLASHICSFCEFGARQYYSFTRYLKPDIMNWDEKLFNEIKPLSPSGISKGIVQLQGYKMVYGLPPYNFIADTVWAPNSAIIDGTYIHFINVSGLIFYTDDKNMQDLLASATIATVAIIVKNNLRRTGTRIGVTAAAQAAINIALKMRSAQTVMMPPAMALQRF